MNKIHTHETRERRLGLDVGHVIIDFAEFKRAQLMECAMENFVNRVNKGEIRSKKTYSQFKQILGI